MSKLYQIPEEKTNEGLQCYFQEKPTENLTDPGHYFAKRYLKKNKFLFNKTEKKPWRLTAFDGGCYWFPYEKRHELFKQIEKDVKTDTKTFWNQIAYFVEGEGSRLVIDIDSSRLLTSEDIQKFLYILRDCLKDYYTNFEKDPIGIFGSKCGPRMSKNKKSTALHFICHVNVSIAEATQLIFGYTLRLRSDKSVNMQDIVIDSGIYKANSEQVSLRLIYSYKLDTCVLCQGDEDERDSCTLCHGKGRIMSKMCYEPFIHLVGDKENELDEDWYMMLQNNSIWPEECDTRKDYHLPPRELKLENQKKRKSGSGDKKVREIKTGNIPNFAYQSLEEEIRKVAVNFECHWKDLVVKDIIVRARGITSVYVDGNGSTICLYANKDHGTRQFFFTLKKNGEMTLMCQSEYQDCKTASKERPIKFFIASWLCNTIHGIENTPTINESLKNIPPTSFQKNKTPDFFVGCPQEIHLKKCYGIKD